MSHRRAIYAARFLRPPGWTKRLLLREKPRDLTGPYENPVRRWVRLREKARQFDELPPPRKIPQPKPQPRKRLQPVEGVPDVDPEVLRRRLEFLLSPIAVEQQLAAPLRTGMSPHGVEYDCWQRQLRDLRRVYRAQYLQKLGEVTELERRREAELHEKVLEERRKRKQAHLHRVGEDMKRRAIIKDRKRIEAKVTEAMEMARRSKIKRERLYWFRRMENLSKLIVDAKNFDEVFGGTSDGSASPSASSTARSPIGDGGGGNLSESGALLARNVSVPFLLRQLGGAKGFPQQKSRRIPIVDNIHREVLESSYDILPEDANRFEPEPAGPTSRDRAFQLYGGFSDTEKMALLDQKIEMVARKMEEDGEKTDHVLVRLHDALTSAKLAAEEGKSQEELKVKAKESRGSDPAGLPPSPGAAESSQAPVISGRRGSSGGRR